MRRERYISVQEEARTYVGCGCPVCVVTLGENRPRTRRAIYGDGGRRRPCTIGFCRAEFERITSPESFQARLEDIKAELLRARGRKPQGSTALRELWAQYERETENA
jgi:UDP:flavonoid glycosyltransferase YjiC (YdhE family)